MMMLSPPTILALLMTLAQAAPPRPVTQASAKAHAQILLREGTTLFDRGDAAAALRKFEQAYAIFPSPKIWFDVGVAERALDRPVEALQAFQRFLAEAVQAPVESRREAQEAVATLMSGLGRLTVECAVPGVDVSLDGKPAGVTPLAGPIWATPGTHQLAARREGMVPDVQDVSVAAASERTVTLAPRSAAAPVAVTVAPPPPAAPVAVTAAPLPAVAPTVREAPAAPPLVSPASPAISSAVATSDPPGGQRSLAQRWWFWTAVGAVVVAGVGIALATRGGGTDVPGTSLGSQGFP